jgi:hypothetical protein
MKGMLYTCTSWKRLFFILLVWTLATPLARAQNPIVVENALTGNPASEWDINGAGDLSIQGFATDISVNRGERVHFKIKTTAPAYTIDIYRLGYYNGNGARKVGSGVVSATLPQTQPPAFEDALTGLVDCGTWNESGYWDVPSTAVSGIYIARLKKTSDGGASHIIFIVRDDASTSDLFFQTSDATWQAYNAYGGNSLYVGSTSYPAGHATKVSYNRPFITRDGGGGGGAAEDWVFNAEYPMLRFLEKNGFNVSYTTNVDAARRGNLILNHKVFLSVGHDEYWSSEQRANVEAARNAGVHLAFFSGNEIYWKTRWENSAYGTNNSYRTLVCYKEGTLGETVCGTKCDPTPAWTGLWRSGCEYPAGGACLPENALSGQISWDGSTSSIKVPAAYRNLRFWRNTSIVNLGSEDEATLPFGTLGYEWNFEQYAESNPRGRITMSSTVFNGKTHKLSLYRHTSGALVFGAGTVQWAWGLDDKHDRGNLPADVRMQQATINLLADMGVQPATLQSGLMAATKSTDNTAPVAAISTPGSGSSYQSGSSVTISGTATDAGGVVAGVEISTDGGATWQTANGRTNWNYTWFASVPGSFVVKVRAFDDSGNMQPEGTAPSTSAINVTITNPQCPCNIFPNSAIPYSANNYDNEPGIEIGVKFQASQAGYITGLRFYKGVNDVGTHTGSLWTTDGELKARAIFVNESASGWQQVLFSSPVAIQANQTYIASYHSPTGFYSYTPTFFIQPYPSGYLTAAGGSVANGLYQYTTTPTFPGNSYQQSNYWVDIVFDLTAGPDVTPPVVLSSTPPDLASLVPLDATIKATFNEAILPASVTTGTFELRGPGNALISSTVSTAQSQVTLIPSAALAYATTYTARISGGVTGIKDLAGNNLAADYTWTFTTADPPPLPPTDGTGGPVLIVSNSTNPFSRYAVEILRAEGITSFATKDISQLSTAADLNGYDAVVLGEMTLNAAQATLFTNWVTAGGTLIAFRPGGTALSSLMGITKLSGTLSDKYLLVNTATGAGAGITNQTLQFHGAADLYSLNGATAVATLYANANTATTYPAVTTRNVGSNGGRAIAFTYDLAKSIIYTRQGNPAWAGQERDGQSGPIRSNDLFFGGTEPDWIDLNKVAIPQADEQQRLLTNLVIKGALHRKPLPRFWFLPRNLKAAVVMTGDDHTYNGTPGRFTHYLSLGPNTPQDVRDWKAIRATSYILNNTPITNDQAAAFESQGFEVALHLNTDCSNFTSASFSSNLTTQLAQLANQLPGISAPVTNRTHCIAWSDWASAPKIEAQNKIRLDVNYYYWPASWVQNRSGMFTGSGMPMRFADLDGTLIDCYQVATQMTDESGIDYNTFSAQLFDRALGAEGYYGVFCANMHTDSAMHAGSEAIITQALARNIPVISAKQLLTWLDGRNNSTYDNIAWNNNQLTFNLNARTAAYNLRGMLPMVADNGQQLSQITRNGGLTTFTTETIKGIAYAFFEAQSGTYVATYGPVTTGTIRGSVTLQARPAAPHASWQVPLTVNLYAPGNNTTPVLSYTTTTENSGKFSISGVPAGTYNIAVKNSHTLQRVKSNQAIVAGDNAVAFGTLSEGDVNNDNFITLIDLTTLLSAYLKSNGDAGYVANADLNNDGYISLLDLTTLLSNYLSQGETP